MAKYLDISGLQRVWSRISSRVIRGDAAQSFTDAYKMQARANISAGASNRNLLDNPFFTVNQRGYTNGSASSNFVADRWFLYGAPDLTVTNSGNGLVLTGSGQARLRSHYDEKIFMALYGQTLTFSIKINGKVYSETGTVPSSYPSAQTAFINSSLTTDVGRIELVVTWQISTNTVLVYFRVYQAMTIQAVKLELGSYSTLANDVPPDYGEELRKCQRYFVRIASSVNAFPVGFGVKDSATIADIFVPTPVEMRVTPSTSKNGTHRVWGGNAASRDVSSYSTVTKTTTGVYLRATISSGSLGDYYTYVIYLQSGAYIDFSADL